MNLKLTSIALAALLLGGQAGAAMVKYTDEASFTGALQSYKVEDLESFEPGESAPAGQPLALTFGTGSTVATLSGPDTMRSVDEGDTQGRTSIGNGTKIFWEGGGAPFTITFLSAIKAFGFWTSDVGDFTIDCPGCSGPADVLTVQFFNGADLLLKWDIQGSTTDGALAFWGVVSEDSFDRIVFTNNTVLASTTAAGVADGQGFDNFIYGTPNNPPPSNVPEPGALALAGLGLVALAARRRRRV